MTMNAPDSDTTLEAVCAALRAELHLSTEPIESDDRLDLLPNADSVRLMRTVSRLERHFDIELDDTAIRKAETVSDLVQLVRDGLGYPDGPQ
jgi:acyl carrier protein